jgi:HEAT repeat protein
VPALAELLTHESGVGRGLVAEAIGWLGPDAAEAVPALTKTLTDSNPIVQVYAADALARIGPKADTAIPALVALLGDPKTKDPRVITPGRSSNPKDAATAALVRIGPKGIAAVKEKVLPGLIEEYKTAKPSPWDGPGMSVLEVLGKDAAPALPAIKDYILRRGQGSDLDRLVPALLKLGPDGVKALLEILADKRADRRAMIGALATSRVYYPQEDLTPLVPTLVAALKDENKSIRGSAAWALSYLGAKTPPEVIDVMVARLAEGGTDNVSTFERLGEVAVPALVTALKGDNANMRKGAASALARIGGAAQSALPALRELAQEKDPQLALAASAAAARISLEMKDVATVFRFLKDEDPKVRLEALERVVALGPLAVPFQKGLIALLDDKDTHVKERAVEAIGLLGQDVPEAIAALAGALPPPEKWGIGLKGSGKPLGPALKPAVPALIKALSDDKAEIRYVACRLLRQIGPGAKDAVPALLDLLKETREAYRANEVLAALEAIGPGAKDAVPLLARVVPYREAVLCLGGIGPAAKEAVPALRKSLTDPDPDVRLAAAYALARIEGDVPKYRDEFVRAMLPPPGERGGGLVLAVFDKLAPDCPQMIPGAVGLFPKLTPYDRGVLVASIGKYGRVASAVVPDLVKMMADEKGLQQYEEIATTLGAIGPGARAALPELRKLLKHRDLKIAVAARDAIARIAFRP